MPMSDNLVKGWMKDAESENIFSLSEDVHNLPEDDRVSYDDQRHTDWDRDPSDVWDLVIDNNLTEGDLEWLNNY